VREIQHSSSSYTWVEQALRQALGAKAEPARPEDVELDELEAMVRRVVAEELRPMKEALARLDSTAPVAATPSPATGDGRSPVSSVRERMRQRRPSRRGCDGLASSVTWGCARLCICCPLGP
jgi:hypothetical protein